MGLDESLESRDALKAHTTSEPTGGSTQSGNRKRKTTSQVWSHFELLPLAEDGRKKNASIRSAVPYTCVTVRTVLVI